MNIVSVTSEEKSRASLWLFEQTFHKELYDLVTSKLPAIVDAKILDISEDACTFSVLLAKRMHSSKLVTCLRECSQLPINDKVETLACDFKDMSKLEKLGKYDLIIMKEVVHEIGNLQEFLIAIQKNFRNDNSRLIILDRPRNPPLPVPNSASTIYMQYSVVREKIDELARQANFVHTCFSYAMHVNTSSVEWRNILMGRFFPCVKNARGCDDAEIVKFIKRKGKSVQFEEKLFIFMMRLPTLEEMELIEKERAEELAEKAAIGQPKLKIIIK